MHHKTGDDARTAGRVIHMARWYDLFGRVISLGRDKAIRAKLIELAAPAPGENVLDVGCGTGTLAVALKAKVRTGEVHGIDASREMIEVAKEKAAKNGSGVAFQVGLDMQGVAAAAIQEALGHIAGPKPSLRIGTTFVL